MSIRADGAYLYLIRKGGVSTSLRTVGFLGDHWEHRTFELQHAVYFVTNFD